MQGGRGLPPLQALSLSDFRQLGDFIHAELGIKMPDIKRGMVESRLRKRLTLLKLTSFEAYCKYLFSPDGRKNELTEFINAVTTNKTDFFRESRQFTFLSDILLPGLADQLYTGGSRPIEVWSAACSKGHEPYTLAMVLSEFSRAHPDLNLKFNILGTDISTRVLATAKKAVYPHDEIEPVAMALRKRYLLKSRDRTKQQVRIVPKLRSMVRFRRLNLMDRQYPGIGEMDIIFLRNVMIYFERDTQNALLHRLITHLKPGGHLFVGHSEVLQDSTLPLVSRQAAIYQKR